MAGDQKGRFTLLTIDTELHALHTDTLPPRGFKRIQYKMHSSVIDRREDFKANARQPHKVDWRVQR